MCRVANVVVKQWSGFRLRGVRRTSHVQDVKCDRQHQEGLSCADRDVDCTPRLVERIGT